MSAVLDVKKLLDSLNNLETKLQGALNNHEEKAKVLAKGTLETSKTLAKLEDKHDALENELKSIIQDMAKKYDDLDTLMGRMRNGGVPGGSGPTQQKSLGETFTSTEEFKKFLATAKDGCPPQGNMPDVADLKNAISRMERKDISSGGDTALRNIFSIDKIQQIFYNPLRPNRIRDLFPVIPTSANSIEFVVETLYDINADMVADGSASPTSDFEFDDETQAVRTLSHWTPINRNLLADVPALEQYINLRLLEGLKEVEDRQILYGDGTSQNLQGIMVTPGVQQFDQSDGQPNDTHIDTLRRAMTRAQLAYFAISAYILNPLDWEAAELTKSTIRDYVWVNVGTGADPTLWKVPVIATTAMNAGEYLTGSFSPNAAIWDRQQASMRVSDSHANMWASNQLAVGLWERLALTVFRPPAFVRGQFNGAPAS